MKIICFIKGIFRSLINLQNISGHDFAEIYDNKDIQILKCEKCNELSIGFKKEKNK